MMPRNPALPARTAQLADAMAELDRSRLAYEQAASSDIAAWPRPMWHQTGEQ